MKKSKKLKLLTSLSSIGLIGTTVPVLATSCSESDSDEYLTDFTWSYGGTVPVHPIAKETMLNAGQSVTLALNQFGAKYDGKDVELKQFYAQLSPSTGEYVTLIPDEATHTYKLTAVQSTPNGGYVDLMLAFVDTKDHYGATTVRISVASTEMTNIKYDGEPVEKLSQRNMTEGQSFALSRSLFSVDIQTRAGIVENITPTKVEAYMLDTSGEYVWYNNTEEGCTIEAVKGIPDFVNVYIKLSYTYHTTTYTGVFPIKITVAHDWETVGYEIGEDGKSIYEVQVCPCGKTQLIDTGKDLGEKVQKAENQADAIEKLKNMSGTASTDTYSLYLEPGEYDLFPSSTNEVGVLPNSIRIYGLVGQNGGVTLKNADLGFQNMYATEGGTGQEVYFDGVTFKNGNNHMTVERDVSKNGGTIIHTLSFKNCNFYDCNVNLADAYITENVTFDNCQFTTPEASLNKQYTNDTISQWNTVEINGKVTNVNITNNIFDGAVYNAFQINVLLYDPAPSAVKIENNEFENIWNRPVLIIADKDTEFSITDNLVAETCNTEDRSEGHQYWKYFKDQLFRIGSIKTDGEQVTENQ